MTLERPLNIAMIDEELPYPPTSGKRIRTLNLTMRLAKRHHITYICHRNSDPDEAREATAYFADHGITPVVVDRVVPPRSGLRFYGRLLMNLLSPLPYSVTSHQSESLQRAIQEHVRTNPVDLWHCEWTPYAQMVRTGLAEPRLAMAHNVESVIWRRYYETERNLLRRWYIGRQYRKYHRFESEALREMDRTVAVSDVDADRFRTEMQVPRVAVVENGVDTEYFYPQSSSRDPNSMLFLGSLDWRPNLDGVWYFLDYIFPTVRRAKPDAKFVVVGRNPPSWLRQRIEVEPGVELHADVPDVRPFLANCGMMVVPLRIGGGSRLKILEALASGTPVVSTRVGAEGLVLEQGEHLMRVEKMDALIPALVSGINSPNVLQEQAERGREWVRQHYDWDVLAEKLEQIWIDCAVRVDPSLTTPAPKSTSPNETLQREGHAA